MDDKKYWIGFNSIKGIGAVRVQGLVMYFGELESAWKASPTELAQASLGLKVIERVIQARDNVDLEKVWEKIEKQGIKILTWQDETYPQRLKEIDQGAALAPLRGPEPCPRWASAGTAEAIMNAQTAAMMPSRR